MHRRAGRIGSVVDDGADALAFVHQIERLVDLLEGHGVGDEVVQQELTLHVALHVARQLAATAHAPKALPRHTRPVTSWNGRVLISWPAPARR